MFYRNLFTLIIIAAAFIVPWWLVLIVCLIGFMRFDFYLEGVAVAGLFDLLYAFPSETFFSFQFLFALLACLSLLVVEYAKHYLILYN